MSHPDDGVLQELLDGELAPADEAVVRAHLASCVACSTLLEELRETQTEAAAIVSRLDLDPPLHVTSSRRAGRRRINTRLLALAASTVLVAGTSWLLLRTGETGAPMTGGADQRLEDTYRDKERSQPSAAREAPAVPAPATTAEPPQRRPPQAPADENSSVADAAPVKPAQETVRKQMKEEEPLPAANAVAGAPVEPVAPLARQSVLTVAAAEAQVGWKVQTIEGLVPQSVELVRVVPDSVSSVLLRYQIGDAAVVLVQHAAASSDIAAFRSRTDESARRSSAEAPLEKRGKDERTAPAPAAAVAATGAAKAVAGPMVSTRTWQAGNLFFELSGALPADSLDALMRRVR